VPPDEQTWRTAPPERPATRGALKRTALLRPGHTHALGRGYARTYRRGAPDAPDWLGHELVTGEDVTRRCPYLDPAPPEAVVYGPAFCAHLPRILDHLIEDASARGVTLERDTLTRLERRGSTWSAHFARGRVHDAAQVVLATGANLARWFPEVDLAINYGELLVVDPAPGVDLDCAISGGGHITPGPDGTWVAGSTYIRDDEDPHARTDDAAERDLHELIGRFLPALRDAPKRRVWRERRLVAMPDRQPVAGRVPDAPGLWVFGALGSKAMMWTRFCARSLAGALLRDAALPEIVSPERVGGTWRLA